MFRKAFVTAVIAVVVTVIPISAHASNDSGAKPVTQVAPNGDNYLGTTIAADKDTEPPLPSQLTIKTYTVQPNEDLALAAGNNDMTPEELRWSNQELACSTNVKEGDVLTTSPVHPGIVYKIRPGDALVAIASFFNVDIQKIIDLNKIGDPDMISVDQQIIIQTDKLPDPCPPAPVVAYSAPVVSSGGPAVSPQVGSIANHFDWGWCTYYVATRRPIPWYGNAVEWGSAARAMGFAEGMTPRVGAVMVTYESIYGHVAYVESVNGASWTVSEMNYVGFGIVSHRTISPGQVPLETFIYQ